MHSLLASTNVLSPPPRPRAVLALCSYRHHLRTSQPAILYLQSHWPNANTMRFIYENNMHCCVMVSLGVSKSIDEVKECCRYDMCDESVILARLTHLGVWLAAVCSELQRSFCEGHSRKVLCIKK